MSHTCYSRSADRVGVKWTIVTLEGSWRRQALKKRQDLDNAEYVVAVILRCQRRQNWG